MARIRTIKPEAFISESLAAVSLTAERTFFGLLTQADDHGRHRDHAAIIAGALWPLRPEHTPLDVEDDLQQLADAELICRYTGEDGKPYLHITGWRRHQKIDRASRSRHPACTLHDGGSVDSSPTSRRGPDEQSAHARRTVVEGSRDIREDAPNHESAGQTIFDEDSTHTHRTPAEPSPSPRPLDLGPRILDQGSIPSGGASAPAPAPSARSTSSASTPTPAPPGRRPRSSATSDAKSTNSSPRASTRATSGPGWSGSGPSPCTPASCRAWSTRR